MGTGRTGQDPLDTKPGFVESYEVQRPPAEVLSVSATRVSTQPHPSDAPGFGQESPAILTEWAVWAVSVKDILRQFEWSPGQQLARNPRPGTQSPRIPFSAKMGVEGGQ